MYNLFKTSPIYREIQLKLVGLLNYSPRTAKNTIITLCSTINLNNMRLSLLFLFVLLQSLTLFAEQAKVNSIAPDFTLPSVQGKEVSLSSYKGKIVVLEWINFDCPYVRKHYETGNIPKMQQEYTKQGVIWLGICSSAPGKQGHLEKKK